jgi:hypothetical protein
MKRNKKSLINLLITFIVVYTFHSCNNEWKDEQYEKYVSFVRSGYTETYLNTNTPDGIVHYKIPIEVSGSTANDRNVTVEVALDTDTLDAHNITEFFTRTDLYFRLLDEQHYTFPNGTTIVIPAGKEVGHLDVDFRIGDLDLVEKYILPLKITATSEYIISPKKHYKRTLMRIIPFNYFSGTYSAAAASVTAEGNSEQTSMATREMRYVSDSTVFFYAGLCEEDARDRATYKVRTTINPDHTITFTADNPNIEFTPILEEMDKGKLTKRCVWTLDEKMDALQPYLSIRTLTMDIKYTYLDISNPYYKVKYTVKGYYTLERRRNTQIPEEDQQEIFEW